ncbi:ubiquinone anaerobic biosynthesis accessory factor UbiT [Neisseriaceae bacterium B1]
MLLPEFKFPKFLANINSHLPIQPPRYALVFALNTMLERELLSIDMSLFAGRTFEIDVLDAGIKIHFTANKQKFLAEHFISATDLRLAANGVDFMRMILREEDPDTLFFNRKLQIEGDTELGLITKNLLDSVDWSQLNPFQK